MPNATKTIGLLALAALLLLVALFVMGTRRPTIEGIDPARIRAVCQQYAGLDLSGLAPLCVEAGYVGEQTYLTTAPEDLGR